MFGASCDSRPVRATFEPICAPVGPSTALRRYSTTGLQLQLDKTYPTLDCST
jgi:hypothetical protein